MNTAPHRTTLRCSALHCITPCYTVLHCATLHCTLCCTVLHLLACACVSVCACVRVYFLAVLPDIIQGYNLCIWHGSCVWQGDFREDGSAWAGSKIGWCWGGRTIQGLMAYYYNRRAEANASIELDPCRFITLMTMFITLMTMLLSH